MDLQLSLQQRTACCLEWTGIHLITHHLPQGSVLGPLLFLLYIKDLANGSPSENCFASLYADDLLYKIITDPRDYVTLQSDINSVADWIIMLYNYTIQ